MLQTSNSSVTTKYTPSSELSAFPMLRLVASSVTKLAAGVMLVSSLCPSASATTSAHNPKPAPQRAPIAPHQKEANGIYLKDAPPAQRITAAYGGTAKIAEFQHCSRTSQGFNYRGDCKVPFTVRHSGDMTEWQESSPGYEILQHFDKNSSWSQVAGLRTERSPQEYVREKQVQAYNIYDLLSMLTPTTEMRFMGSAQVDGHKCSHYQFDLGKDQPSAIYFDEKARVIRRIEGQMTRPFPHPGVVKVVVDYDRYEKYAGFLIPRIVTKKAGPREQMQVLMAASLTRLARPTKDDHLILPAPVSVPLEPNADQLLLLVGAKANGQDVVTILDTAQPTTILNSTFAFKFGVKNSSCTMESKKRETKFSFGTIPKLSFGSLDLANFPVEVLEEGSDFYALRIGNDILRAFAVTFDFDHNLMTFSETVPEYEKDTAIMIPIVYSHSPYVVATDKNGQQVPLLFSTLEMNIDRAGRRINPETQKSTPASAIDATDYTLSGIKMTADEVSLSFGEPAIGTRFLKRFASVIIDNANSRLICTPKKTAEFRQQLK